MDISLNNELYKPKIGSEISELSISGSELFAYFFFAILLAISYNLPFYFYKILVSSKRFWVSVGLFVLFFFIGAIILDISAKGIYLVRYMGDDFPFVHRIFGVFLLGPILLYGLTKHFICKIKKRNILLSFIIGVLAVYLTSSSLERFPIVGIAYFRKAVSNGQFLFYINLFLGMTSLLNAEIISRKTEENL